MSRGGEESLNEGELDKAPKSTGTKSLSSSCPCSERGL
jgi:hypothetical protein